MMKIISSKRFFSVLSFCLVIPLVGYHFLGFYFGITGSNDGFLRWQENSYLLLGIYPVDIISGNAAPIDYIGVIGTNMATVPWSYLLSNLLYPGFFNWKYARIWYFSLFIILTATCCSLLIKNLRKQSFLNYQIIFILFLFFAQFGWASALSKQNNAMFTVISLFIVLLLCEYYPDNFKNNFLIAILMSIAMLKPQIALLFYIPLFWKKRYFSIIASGSIISISWGIVCIISNTSPVTSLIQQLNIVTKYAQTTLYSYIGIFDFLRSSGISYIILLISEMILCLIICFMLGYKIKSSSIWLQFSIPSAFSLLWCYNQSMDLCILSFMIACCGFLLLKNENLPSSQLLYILFLLCFNILPISHTLYAKHPLLPILQRTFYIVGLIILLKNQSFFKIVSERESSSEYIQ